MNEEQKTKIKEVVGNAADELSDKALAAAKEQTNRFWKLLLYAVGIMLAGIAALAGFTGCNGVPQVTAEQVQVAHEVYHAVTGEPCMYRVIPVENVKK
ncbi:MAG: hypothetical protein IJE88_04425 [Akkermansia sp.]|nr:hypothetical protein [Akkermansia sp.]